MEQKQVTIIGAGMSGLGTAIKLLENGVAVTILEAQNQAGGLASNFKIKDKYFPLGYHHILAQDFPLLELLKKLGLYDKVVWKKGKVLFAIDGVTYNLTDPRDFLKFPLTIFAKLRFAGLMLYCALKRDWTKDLGNARDWVDLYAGEEVRKKVFDPLMDIKYGLPSEYLSANWLGSRLHYQEFSKPLGYIEGTDWTKVLVEKLVAKVNELGGKIVFNANVTALNYKADGVTSVSYEQGGVTTTLETSTAVNTAPPHIFKKFCGFNDPTINQIEYLDALSLIVEIEDKLPRNFYLLSALKPRYSFGGIFFLSDLNPTLGTENKTVINFFTNLSSAYEHFREMPESELLEHYLIDFEKIFHFKPKIVWSHRTLIKNYSPKFLKNYSNPSQTTPIKGLYFAGNYLTYPIITSTGSAYASGLKAAELILKSYERPS